MTDPPVGRASNARSGAGTSWAATYPPPIASSRCPAAARPLVAEPLARGHRSATKELSAVVSWAGSAPGRASHPHFPRRGAIDLIDLRELHRVFVRRQRPAGLAGPPIVLVDLEELESLAPDEASLLAHRLPDDLRIYVGVRRRSLPTPLIGPGQQILEGLTTTVSPKVGRLAGAAPQGRGTAISAVVRVDDPLEAAARIAEQGRRNPDAVHVLDTALRIAERAAARETIILESNGYTSLLAGPEYGAWLRAPGHSTSGPPAEIRTEQAGSRRTVTIRWATHDSGMDHALRLALADALLDARNDHVGQIHLRADGPDFCARGIPDDDEARRADPHAYLSRLERHIGVAGWLVHRRLTASVQGRCCSAGLELAAFAHCVTATPDARFAVPHVAFGLCFGAGGTWSLTRRIGRWRTAYLALTGAEIDATTALRWGLIDAIGDPATGAQAPADLVGAPG